MTIFFGAVISRALFETFFSFSFFFAVWLDVCSSQSYNYD